MILHWRTGLDRTDGSQKLYRSGLDRIQFYWIRTGLGLKNFTVLSSLSHSKTRLLDYHGSSANVTNSLLSILLYLVTAGELIATSKQRHLGIL